MYWRYFESFVDPNNTTNASPPTPTNRSRSQWHLAQTHSTTPMTLTYWLDKPGHMTLSFAPIPVAESNLKFPLMSVRVMVVARPWKVTILKLSMEMTIS